MRTFWLLAGVMAAVASTSVVCLGADKAAPAERIARLIADLGSEEFAVREAATEELAQAGLAAFSALEAAANHADREVRYRSQRVLGIIRQHDNERRLEAFLTGKEDANEYPLPGWQRFKAAYGDGSEERSLFVAMQRADAELMRALEDNARRAAETLTQRLMQTMQAPQPRPQPATLGQTSAALFVAGQDDVTLPSQTMGALLNQCFQPPLRDAIEGHQRRDIPRKMLGAAILRCDDQAVFLAMNVAVQFKLSEGIAPATKILKNHEANRSAALAQHALITISKLGDSSHLPLVDVPHLMRDETPVAQFKENETTYVIQLRDVALAAAVVLSKQQLKSYFEIPGDQTPTDPQMIFLNARLIGFASEDNRAAVFNKWRKYKASASQ